eukprot:8508432-Pyramimonas_sp.AAC.1
MCVHKIPSHTSTVDVREGRITEMQRAGNSEADRLAKEGAEPFRIAAADKQLLTGYAEFVRRVGVYCASQQAECRDMCLSDH